jgi:hypothetical protein
LRRVVLPGMKSNIVSSNGFLGMYRYDPFIAVDGSRIWPRVLPAGRLAGSALARGPGVNPFGL